MAALQKHIFAPVFFASIGFTIPFPALFTGTRIWKGIVYTVFMTIGKVLAGLVVVGHGLLSGRGLRKPGKATTNSGSATPDECLEELDLSHAAVHRAGSRRDNAGRIDWTSAAFLGTALVPRGEIGVSLGCTAFAVPRF